jgi:hypothetical protein
MKNLKIKNLVVTGLVLILSLIFSTGYSQRKSDQPLLKGSGGTKLEYNYPVGKTFKYVTDTKIVEDMDVNGQSMLVNVAMSMGCEVKSVGKVAENLKLEIKIDSLTQNVESPQGTNGGSVNDVKGKVFNMVISPAGKPVDLSEAAKVVYTMEGSGESNLSQTFLTYFPALPKNGVNPGDTWATSDTIDSKSQSNSLWMPVQSDFKFEGIENIDGIDCAKITATLSGTRKMSTQSQGMGDIKTSGPFTGTQTLLFAVKEGYLVKETVTSKLTGNIEIPDQNMSFPVVMTITSTHEIVK